MGFEVGFGFGIEVDLRKLEFVEQPDLVLLGLKLPGSLDLLVLRQGGYGIVGRL
jgi:hypothetical protein